MALSYEIVRRDRETPDGSDLTYYEIHVVGPNGERSVQMDRTYETEAEAQTVIDRMSKG